MSPRDSVKWIAVPAIGVGQVVIGAIAVRSFLRKPPLSVPAEQRGVGSGWAGIACLLAEGKVRSGLVPLLFGAAIRAPEALTISSFLGRHPAPAVP